MLVLAIVMSPCYSLNRGNSNDNGVIQMTAAYTTAWDTSPMNDWSPNTALYLELSLAVLAQHLGLLYAERKQRLKPLIQPE
jgi:hypothetical protein